jgi:hypothetical protein
MLWEVSHSEDDGAVNPVIRSITSKNKVDAEWYLMEKLLKGR